MPSKSRHTLDMPAVNFGLPDPSEFNDFSGMASFAGTVDLVPDRSARFCLFDRASRCWWDPRFDSDVLESQYRQTTFPRIRRRLQICLLFALCSALLWCVFLGVVREWWLLGLLLVVGLVPFLVVFIMSGSGRLPGHTDLIACTTAFALCLLSLIPAAARLSFFPGGHAISELQLSAWAVVTIMLIYTMIPLPLYGSVLISLVYSLLLEALNYMAMPAYFSSGRVMAVRAGLHLCVHLMGLRILVLALSHMRNTFSTVGQSLLTRQQLELEKQLKEHMIHSVMPPTLADWVQDELRDEVRQVAGGSCNSRAPREPPGRLCPAGPEISFRPFNMQPMDKVSILFADIVGFTRMSSNKSAEQLVGLLNDLFGRFDALCTHLDCEKISTLGDCYYCVSGCPEPRTDHAHCCVRMGLAMIAAIRDFDVANSEDVNMRVGVHTGRVLCGLVGTKRFKFDVWSNDVSMANRMESTGKPGKVHISEKTLCYLDNRFLVSPGDTVLGVRTYFIVGQKDAATPGSEPSSPAVDSEHPYHAGFKKTRSLPNVIETNVTNMTDIDSRRWTLDRRKKPRFRLHPSPEGDIKGSRKARGEPRRTSGGNPLQPLQEENSSYTDVPFRGLKDCESDAGSDAAPSDSEQEHSDSSESLMSGHSRKDSGIRSRRSSIQAQIAALNGLRPDTLLQHRLSDYYTSSQSSLVEVVNLETFGGLSTASCGDPGELLRQQAMQRKLSDLQMIRCVRQMSTQSNYFLNPPVDPFTLHYHSDELERQYRHQQTRLHHANCNTISLPEYNILVDTAAAALLLLVVSVSAHCSYSPHPHWLVGVAVCLVLLLLLQVVMWLRLRTYSVQGGRYQHIYSWCTSWYSFHVIGSVIISLPVAAVLSTWSCANFSDQQHLGLYFFLFFLCLCHFCNFTQLNFWMKSLLASVSAIAVLVLVAMHASDECFSVFRSEMVAVEIVSCSLVLTILVWILNREFEISYRLGFCVNLLAAQDKCRVQKLMNQADWLLHNIIPRHVAEVIKTKAKYSENHSDVAVVFASIINFNDLYDETYRGGKEYLRVLNEIIGDIDDLLERYPCVEKIKTIGSTYMAASGLNPSQREHAGPLGRDQHLQELMLFALDMQNVVEAFNASLFEFEMQLRIGYNMGDVTAGVIGTTKLYYDIWGDTVNTASRMDGTGVAHRIHTTGACAERLKPYFIFEERGEIFVKGKDYMMTYFVNGRRTDGDTTG